MEGTGRAKRRRSVISPTPPPPPPPPPPSPPPPTNEGDDEEEGFKKFSELIENIKALRSLEGANPSKRPRKEDSLWKPRFKLDDFKDDRDLISSEPLLEPPPKREEEARKEEEVGKRKSGLDLNLFL